MGEASVYGGVARGGRWVPVKGCEARSSFLYQGVLVVESARRGHIHLPTCQSWHKQGCGCAINDQKVGRCVLRFLGAMESRTRAPPPPPPPLPAAQQEVPLVEASVSTKLRLIVETPENGQRALVVVDPTMQVGDVCAKVKRMLRAEERLATLHMKDGEAALLLDDDDTIGDVVLGAPTAQLVLQFDAGQASALRAFEALDI